MDICALCVVIIVPHFTGPINIFRSQLSIVMYVTSLKPIKLGHDYIILSN